MRFFLSLVAFLQLVAAFRSLVDEKSILAWRNADAIWGPSALPFNVAAGVMVAVGYLLAATAPGPLNRAWVKRFGGFAVLHLVQTASEQGSYFFPIIVAIGFAAYAYNSTVTPGNVDQAGSSSTV